MKKEEQVLRKSKIKRKSKKNKKIYKKACKIRKVILEFK